MTSRVGADDQIKGRLSDVIDPALVRADLHVKFRVRQLRAMLQRGLGVGEGKRGSWIFIRMMSAVSY